MIARKWVQRFVWLCLLCLLPRPSSAGAGAEVIDRILAVVGGKVITQTDVNAALELGLVTVDETDTDRTGAVLAKLVDRQLVLAEVDRYAPPEPTTQAVDAELQTARSRFGSPADYTAALARSGIEEKRLRQTLRDDLRIRAYLEQRFTVAPPSDADLTRYYREHPLEFTRNGEVAPFEAVRSEIVRAMTSARRAMLAEDWVAGLRRRGEIRNLSVPPR